MNEFIKFISIILFIVLVFGPYASLWNLGNLKDLKEISEAIYSQAKAIHDLAQEIRLLRYDLKEMKKD